MKTTSYKHHNLHHNSQAYQLLLQWQRTGDKQDQQKLDKHLREVEARYRELHYG